MEQDVSEVLKKALAKSASDRYSTCLEFVDALAAALELSPGWHPLPRSSAQSMPTFAGAAVEVPRTKPVAGQPAAPPPAPPRVEQPVGPGPVRQAIFSAEEAETSHPLLKSLVWMLVSIGMVGLVLFGAQKYLFNRNAEPAPAAVAETPPSTAPAADDADSKPSPVGQAPSPAGDAATQPAPASEKPPEATAPETKASETKVPESFAAPANAEPKLVQATPPPVVAPKPGFEQSVQFLTEPPGAQVVIDGNSSQTCRTPCQMPLAAGRHALNVQLPGYRPYPRVFNIPQENDIFLQLAKASGTLSITSTPPGATIELNGAPQSNRTPAIFTLAPGSYHFKVVRSGAALDFDVQLRDGDVLTKHVDF